MIATLVHIAVKEDYLDQFIEITRYNHNNSIQEKGNIRFDFLQDREDPCKFTLYEVFESEDAIAFHKETEHYLKWRETVQDWMAEPRKGIKHKVVEPIDPSLW
jgi:autoinducer 2-degrading protein